MSQGIHFLAGATPEAFVRMAQPEDAGQIGKLQAKNMRQALVREVAQVSPAELEQLDALHFAQAWQAAIEQPPSAKHHVLSALQRGKVVGFAAIAPASQDTDFAAQDTPGNTADTNSDAESGDTAAAQPSLPPLAEIIAFEVADWQNLVGHEARLINACVDILRKTGAQRVQTWVGAGDTARIRFLQECGFAPGGVRQVLQVGRETFTQHLWHTDLRENPSES